MTQASAAAHTEGVTTLLDKKREEMVTAYTFIAPAMLIFLVFLIVPIAFALYISFTDWNGITPLNSAHPFNFVGLSNYSQLLVEPTFRQTAFFTALKNTIYYVLGVVPIQTILALLLAVIVNQRWLRVKGFFRTAFYFPSITSSIVISLIFMWMFQRGGLVNNAIAGLVPSYNPVNWLNNPDGIITNILGLFGVTLRTAGPWAQTKIAGLYLWNWISGPSVTMLMIMILNIWTTTGTMMVIYLAALQDIPTPVYEAATVDGASAWQNFRYIVVPLLRPTTFFIVTLGLIGTFQVFDQIYVISAGGPANTTVTVAYLVYQNGFQNSAMGLATATSILLFIIIFVFSILQRQITTERGEA